MIDKGVFEASLLAWHGDVKRNIKSLRVSEDLFDDLSDDPADYAIAIEAELATKPKDYMDIPIIARPFERARYNHAIAFPFRHWSASRFSDGSFGVWYGAKDLRTTVAETVFHWVHDFLSACGFDQLTQPIIGERRVFNVDCRAFLLDLRSKTTTYPELVDPDPAHYAWTQQVGLQLNQQGYPGLINRSARASGDVFAVFKSEILSKPRDHCFLTYRYEAAAHCVKVEREPGKLYAKIVC